MLDHPWFNVAANYDYKYTDKEYEIMLLKKDIQSKKVASNGLDDSYEMNELIDSDQEQNAADFEETRVQEKESSGEEEDEGEESDERSLMESDEERE